MRERPNRHIYGAAQHGAFGQTIRSLEKHHLLEMGDSRNKYGESIWHGRLTMRGVRAHRQQCCKRGLTEDDIIARGMEETLSGEVPKHGIIPF